MKCDGCGSTEFIKNGTKISKKDGGRVQKYICKGCGADKKGELIEPFTKGKTEITEAKQTIEEDKKPKNLMNLMKKL